MFNWMKLLFYRFNSIFSRCTNVSLYFSPSLSSRRFRKPDRSYFKRRLEQRSTEGSSLPDAWFQASRSRLSFKVGILIERRQKAGRAGRQALVSPLPQLFYPLVLAVLHFPQMRALILSISGGTYVVWKVRTTCDCFWAHPSARRDAVFPSTERSFV